MKRQPTGAPAQTGALLMVSQPAALPLGSMQQISYAAFMPEKSDEQLMQQYARGDAHSFELLYARHKGALYRYFRRQINDESTANDLYQGVWEKIIKARRKYKNTTPFAAWMFRIAHNHLVDHYRRHKPVEALDDLQQNHKQPNDKQPGPADFLIDRQQRGRLLSEIALLPEEQRSTLLLKIEAGLKMEQIAAVTGVNRETVKSRLRYAVNRLKRNLLE